MVHFFKHEKADKIKDGWDRQAAYMTHKCWESADWTDVLVQDRSCWWILVNMTTNVWVPHKVGNFLTSRGTISYSQRVI